MPFKETKASISTTERDAAAQASQDCRDCGGAGVVAIFHPAYSGQSVGVTKDGQRYVATAAAHCHCLFGRWIRDHLPPEIQARIPRVEDILSKQSKWLLEPPGDVEGYPGGRVNEEDFVELWRKIKGGHMLKCVSGGAPPKRTAWMIETSLRKRLARELGLEEEVAEVLSIEELRKIETIHRAQIAREELAKRNKTAPGPLPASNTQGRPSEQSSRHT